MRKCILFFPVLALAIQPALLKEEKFPEQNTTVFSRSGMCRAEFDYTQGNPEFIPIADFTLYDRSGAVIYRKSDFGHTLFDIADNGCVAGIDYDGPVSGKGTVHFYDARGVETGRAEIGFLNTRSFSRDGSVYCVHDGINGVRVFDQTGGEMYNLGMANSCALSPDGRLAALATDDRITIYEGGKETGRMPIGSPFVRQMVFSADGSIFAFIDRKALLVYDIPGRSVKLKTEEAKLELEYISLDISADNSLIIAGLDEDMGRGAELRHSRGFINIMDMDGNRQWQTEVRYGIWNASVPRVEFTGERAFKAATADKILYYQF